ncbi:binding-protein-dependent transport systems inner membrane component [Methylobacterium sp. 4-46]|uniref:ABC transporter permease n=2 Tax=Methylobacterium TaxID=407 RepID=UPI000152CBBD|nr:MULTISPECIES: ABC transporter permease [Methylobacterium]ACA18406.1 binding-protein-dependent transport systems inner membrane component [Methylobacterium sp. 4-46]WFT77695.1 ABC transporter permease [Methylobacterium nodulans]
MSRPMSRPPGALDRLSFEIVVALLAGAALILLLAPTVIVLVVSFTDGLSLRFPPPGYSLRWYGELAEAWQLHFALRNSLTVAAAATLLSVGLGVMASLAVARSPRLAARLLDSLFLSPLVLPALAFGLSSLMFFSLLGWPVSVTTLVIGHTVVCVPYVVRNTVAALTQLQPVLLEGSASLGASRLYTLRRITLPLIRPGVLSGGFLAFMASFDNIPVSLFLRDAATDMLPIRMWQDLEGRLDVTIAALSGVLIVATMAGIAVMERLTGLSKRLA